MLLLSLKAAHIIGFVVWFAGLFYWLRMFVYLREAADREELAAAILVDQFDRMQRRVYGIIVQPGLVLTLIGGIGMLVVQPAYLSQGWLQVKLGLVLALIVFQFYAAGVIKHLAVAAGKGESLLTWTGTRLRLLNEVPTVFLLGIVMLAVFRQSLHAGAAFSLTLAFIVLLGVGVRAYKNYRLRHPDH